LNTRKCYSKKGRRIESGSGKQKGDISNKEIREGIAAEVVFEQRLNNMMKTSITGKAIPDRRHS
jgi:hypothetical protein